MGIDVRSVHGCIYRLYTAYSMYCPPTGGDECDKLMRYALDDLLRRIEGGEGPWNAYDDVAKMVRYYARRDCSDPDACMEAWKGMSRTIRYCIKEYAQLV
ncbi:MAG: hypothetical protein ACP5ID_06685 [Conexivisphaera sp.]